MAISITVSTPGGVGHTTITSSTVALGAASAAGMAVVPQNGITSSNVQAALEELASFNFQQWVPIMVGSVDGDSDSIDAGAF